MIVIHNKSENTSTIIVFFVFTLPLTAKILWKKYEHCKLTTNKKDSSLTYFKFGNVKIWNVIFHANLYKMRWFSTNKILTFIVLLSLMCEVVCIKCYQCSSATSRGCFKYNLNSAHLKECKDDRGVVPICRSLSQVNYFLPGQDVNILRECAYVYEEPLTCVQSKFSKIHYSQVCECKSDGCNPAANVKLCWEILVCALLLALVIK